MSSVESGAPAAAWLNVPPPAAARCLSTDEGSRRPHSADSRRPQRHLDQLQQQRSLPGYVTPPIATFDSEEDISAVSRNTANSTAFHSRSLPRRHNLKHYQAYVASADIMTSSSNATMDSDSAAVPSLSNCKRFYRRRRHNSSNPHASVTSSNAGSGGHVSADLPKASVNGGQSTSSSQVNSPTMSLASMSTESVTSQSSKDTSGSSATSVIREGCARARVLRQRSRSRNRNNQRPKSAIFAGSRDESPLSSKESVGSAVHKRLKKLFGRDRPKSDLGGSLAISEALQKFNETRVESLNNLPIFTKTVHRESSRRMSTPQPIKTRSMKYPPRSPTARRVTLRRSLSAPNVAKAASPKKFSRRLTVDHDLSDLAEQDSDDVTDQSDDNCETISLGGMSEASAAYVLQDRTEPSCDYCIMDDKTPEVTLVEGLWDHVTLDAMELAFQAGDVIRVTDREDKDWWWGAVRGKQGWFPAAFVRICARQTDSRDSLVTQSPSVTSDQVRNHVVSEIIHAERDYVRQLKDVVEGYTEKCRRRPEMFSEDRISRIFGNMEEILRISNAFLKDLDVSPRGIYFIGRAFLKQGDNFAIYSDYCNNHPLALQELKVIQRCKRYQHFFEACRLLQQMIEIPLEGFLLIPVQKICKYPLQLSELLRYTATTHPDHAFLVQALSNMKRIATMINERKRRIESLEKLAKWQLTINEWQGPHVLERSCELILSGDLGKINRKGFRQERVFFLFDGQVVYCKRDMLWREVLTYKGQIFLDDATMVVPVRDGKDVATGASVKHGLKILDRAKDKWYLLCASSDQERDTWMAAFMREREVVRNDALNGYTVPVERRKAIISRYKLTSQTKASTRKKAASPSPKSPLDTRKRVVSAASVVTSPKRRDSIMISERPPNKKRPWNIFHRKKSET